MHTKLGQHYSYRQYGIANIITTGYEIPTEICTRSFYLLSCMNLSSYTAL